MSDIEQIQALYLCLYDGMVRKDRSMLDRILDNGFVMDHMTGQRQKKDDFISSVLDGTIRCFAVRHESLPATVRGDHGELIGRAQVTAELFGGRRETLSIQLVLVLEKAGRGWKIAAATASAY